ncbi:hypothetical protein [Alterisphingorhabdus coralli]|uniref:Uncharacterized protein n=1 Tax=Alterisphingorhabdus coralli TaxID=3071408 RepID=A0AA97F682_9SPHN|nr:hypothetical protein [Parasphingorhabdus sp. SCSIO 66989]WOE74048.1 hypothetical protein RB602_09255 [Parasphingorhabdus sp. SCSIO 66989]WOE75557.1 hypothetical protein RB602_02250 [Parasphingorhabdus sp. SCSIO 66989]
MSGAYSAHEFLDAVDCIVQTLVANGMDEIRSANIYINPYRHCELLAFHDQDMGKEFQLLDYQGRRKREFVRMSPRVQPVFEKE